MMRRVRKCSECGKRLGGTLGRCFECGGEKPRNGYEFDGSRLAYSYTCPTCKEDFDTITEIHTHV